MAMARAIVSLFLMVVAAQAKHHHHRHHEQKRVEAQQPQPEEDDRFSPEEMQEAQKADDDSYSTGSESGVYDMRGDHFDILDTPEKMDPDYQAKQNLAAVNKANNLRGSEDDDDDDE